MAAIASADPRGVRFTAAMSSVVLAVGFGTQSWRILAAQAILFALCAFLGLRFNPYGAFFRRAVAPRLAPASRGEAAAPLRFAQGIGFVFTLTSSAAYAVGLNTLGAVAVCCALIAALLNAMFGYCLGCQFYFLLRHRVPGAG